MTIGMENSECTKEERDLIEKRRTFSFWIPQEFSFHPRSGMHHVKPNWMEFYSKFYGRMSLHEINFFLLRSNLKKMNFFKLFISWEFSEFFADFLWILCLFCFCSKLFSARACRISWKSWKINQRNFISQKKIKKYFSNFSTHYRKIMNSWSNKLNEISIRAQLSTRFTSHSHPLRS